MDGTKISGGKIGTQYWTLDLYTGDKLGLQVDYGAGYYKNPFWSFTGASGNNTAGNFSVSSNRDRVLSDVTVTTSSEGKAFDGTPLTGTATITGLFEEHEGQVTVTATGSVTDVGSVTNTYTIDWGEADSSVYKIVEDLGTLTVTPNDTLIIITSGDGYMRYKPYDCIVKNSEYTVEGLPAGFTLTAEITGEQSWEVGSSPNTIASWTILNADNEDVTDRFSNVQKVEGTLTVDKAIVSIWSDDRSKTYDGTPLQGGTIHWTGIYGTDNAQHGISIYHANSLTDAGSIKDEFTVVWNYPELEDMYEISENPGTITVNPAELTIATSSASKPYDGTPLTSAGVTVTGLVSADESRVTVTATGTITEIGTALNTYTINWGGANSDNYTITKEYGTLEITPPELLGADLIISIADDSGVYSGQEQGFGGSGLTVTFAGETLEAVGGEGVIGNISYDYEIPNGDSFTLTVKGGGVNVGEYPMTGSVSFTNGSASDYELSISNGTYTISKLGLIIDLGGGGSAVYSGTVAGEPGAFTVKYTNGDHAGETVSSDGGAIDTGSVTRTYTLYTFDSFSIRADMPTEVGTHALSEGVNFSSGSASNYSISYTNNSFTVEPLKIAINLIGYTTGYSGYPSVPDVEISYTNGPNAGDPVDAEYQMDDDYVLTVNCTLVGGGTMRVIISPSGIEPDTYTITPEYSISGTASNYEVTANGCTITVTPEPYSTDSP